mmetsp:Transcript_39538/g.93054  ORF Transcript_39538/g.93054 Transcript_39538/m.93054 type:complete len:101 (-) Transcript_39538:460-762(-)
MLTHSRPPLLTFRLKNCRVFDPFARTLPDKMDFFTLEKGKDGAKTNEERVAAVKARVAAHKDAHKDVIDAVKKNTAMDVFDIFGLEKSAAAWSPAVLFEL